MKPLSFENLRRFMIGGKKKKDRNESSFKRSDSFKRISIKRNYLDRGKKHRQQAVEAAVVAATCTNVEATVKVTKPSITAASVSKATSAGHIARARGGGKCQSPVPINGDSLKAPLVKPAASPDCHDSMVIGYNQWLKGMKTDDTTNYETTAEEKPPTPPPRKKTGSLSGSFHSSTLDILKLEHSPVAVEKKYHGKNRQPSPTVNKSRDSLISLSPQISRSSLSPVPSRTDSGLSINLGRVWIDAPLAMAPRSLELPRPVAPPAGMSNEPARIHHSLDSALKESGRTSRRHHLETSPITSNSYYVSNLSSVSRTLSSSTTHTNKSRDSSSKDSGFSFSISIPRLTDFTSISGNTSGFFRKKKKLTRPKPSVSRDGYFKRTSGATRITENKLNSVKRSNSKKKRAKREKATKGNACRSDIYAFAANRSTKSLKSLKMEPMVFVTPEKRKPGGSQKKYHVKEVRDFSLFVDVPSPPLFSSQYEANEMEDEEQEDKLYESIGDHQETADLPTEGQVCNTVDDKDSDGSEINYTDTDDERGTFIPLGVSPVPRRKPVRKKKSTRRNVKYVAKPGIHRAQSTLRRSRRAKKTGT
ncbi:hypothetical protein RUM44_009396 [Polyplax serrata]|uniref:Uncharacterized protein n=1 Tax=Polyplax serrata TaxID=468196 RepID=A0ABR1ASK6_POLSC